MLVPQPSPRHDTEPVLKVNPEMLRELANSLAKVADAVRAIKPDAAVDGPVTSLAASDTARACCDIAAEIKVHLDSFAQHMSAMASSARGGGSNFDDTEADFTAQLAAIGSTK